MRRVALDLFCGAGGATLGLQQAGFDVVGVDIEAQPNYPGDFIQGDVATLPVSVMDFDFVWASPPCQRFSIGTYSRGRKAPMDYPDWIPLTREVLSQHPYTCIENVPQAPLRQSIILTGDMLGLQQLRRKRAFELSFFAWQPAVPKLARGNYISVTTSMCATTHFYRRKAEGKKGRPSLWLTKAIMGFPLCFPISYRGIGNAVAPPMAKYIGDEVMRHLK